MEEYTRTQLWDQINMETSLLRSAIELIQDPNGEN